MVVGLCIGGWESLEMGKGCGSKVEVEVEMEMIGRVGVGFYVDEYIFYGMDGFRQHCYYFLSWLDFLFTCVINTGQVGCPSLFIDQMLSNPCSCLPTA